MGDCATSATHRNFFLDRTLSIVAGSLRVGDEVDTGCEGRRKPRRSAMERKVEVRKCRTLKEQLTRAGSAAGEAAGGPARGNNSTGKKEESLGGSRSCADREWAGSLPWVPRSREQATASQGVAASQARSASRGSPWCSRDGSGGSRWRQLNHRWKQEQPRWRWSAPRHVGGCG